MSDESSKSDFKTEEHKRSLVRAKGKHLADHQGEWVSERDGSSSTDLSLSKEEPDSTDIFRSFARQIARIKRLSEEEEYELGMRVQEKNDVEAKKKLILHNMRLALKMAHQYRRDWTNLMDLVQEASAGMAIAAKKWDPRVGTRFGTYAAYWIRAQLTKFIMTNARLIHTGTTRAGRKVYFSLPQVRKKLLLEGKKPTVELIAKEVGEDEKEVSLILSRLEGREASLSAPMEEDGSITLEDTISSEGSSPEHEVTHNEMQRIIKDLITSFEKTIKNER